MSDKSEEPNPIRRRSLLQGTATALGVGSLAAGAQSAVSAAASQAAVSPNDKLQITKLETFLVKPRWLFLKMYTNAGLAEAYYAACVQLDATIPNFMCQEYRSLGEGYLKEPLTFKDGYIELPTKPGLGIALDENALADKIDHDWRNPETYLSEDNSVVDW